MSGKLVTGEPLLRVGETTLRGPEPTDGSKGRVGREKSSEHKSDWTTLRGELVTTGGFQLKRELT